MPYLEPICWVYGDDEGLDLCRACAVKIVSDILAEAPGRDVTVGGGMDTEHEVQSPAQCGECGTLLACSLMDGTRIQTTAEWEAVNALEA